MDWDTDRLVVRGDIHCLTFHPTRSRHRKANARPNPREEEGEVVFELEEENGAVASPSVSTPPSAVSSSSSLSSSSSSSSSSPSWSSVSIRSESADEPSTPALSEGGSDGDPMEWLRSRSSIMHVVTEIDQFEGFAMAAMPDVGAPAERPIKRPKTVEETPGARRRSCASSWRMLSRKLSR